MDTILQDVRFGARMLLKRPGFTVGRLFRARLGLAPLLTLVNEVLLLPARRASRLNLTVALAQN